MSFEINVDKYSFAQEAQKSEKGYADYLAEKEQEERRAADALLSHNIAAEKEERIGADALLSKAISEESSTRAAADTELKEGKADRASTLAGYGITDAYTKTEADNLFAAMVDQTYDGESENAQSGKALKPVLDNLQVFAEKALSTAQTAFTDVNSIYGVLDNAKADRASTLAGYGITDAQQKVVIISNMTNTAYGFEFSNTHNIEIRLGEVSGISFTFGNGEYNADYTSGLSFDSGATPTAIDYTNSGILNWVGTDCTTVDGLSIFMPSANTHYDIVFYFNGTQFIGLVNGFVPASGNVVSA